MNGVFSLNDFNGVSKNTMVLISKSCNIANNHMTKLAMAEAVTSFLNNRLNNIAIGDYASFTVPKNAKALSVNGEASSVPVGETLRKVNSPAVAEASLFPFNALKESGTKSLAVAEPLSDLFVAKMSCSNSSADSDTTLNVFNEILKEPYAKVSATGDAASILLGETMKEPYAKVPATGDAASTPLAEALKEPCAKLNGVADTLSIPSATKMSCTKSPDPVEVVSKTFDENNMKEPVAKLPSSMTLGETLNTPCIKSNAMSETPSFPSEKEPCINQPHAPETVDLTVEEGQASTTELKSNGRKHATDSLDVPSFKPKLVIDDCILCHNTNKKIVKFCETHDCNFRACMECNDLMFQKMRHPVCSYCNAPIEQLIKTFIARLPNGKRVMKVVITSIYEEDM